MIQPDQLASDRFALLAEMTHASLADFVIDNFLRKTSWLTRLHHAMTIATVAAVLIVAMKSGRPLKWCLLDFVLALVALFLFVLPIHELLHAVAYRIVGAKDIRWDYSWRMAAVWVTAHRFVATAGPFVFVALLPFVVVNAALILAAVLVPQAAVFLLFVLLWHLHGCIGDWSLLNFIWLHRRRGFWTFDDADAGKSYFFGRAV